MKTSAVQHSLCQKIKTFSFRTALEPRRELPLGEVPPPVSEAEAIAGIIILGSIIILLASGFFLFIGWTINKIYTWETATSKTEIAYPSIKQAQINMVVSSPVTNYQEAYEP